MLAALLALVASLAWGSSDFLGGLYTRRHSVWSVNAVSQPAAVLAAAILVLFDAQSPPELTAVLGPSLGGIAGAMAIVAYYRALAMGTMSIVAPIIATSAAVPVLVGVARGEHPAVLQYIGIALAVAGIALISRAEGRGPRRTASLASVLFALGAAVGFGAMLVGLDMGAANPSWAVLSTRFASACTIGAYLAARRPRLELTPSAVPLLAAVGLLLVVANTLFTMAAARGYLSVVGVLGSLAPVVTACYARWVLTERLTQMQLAAAGTVLAGVICLAAG